MLPLPRTEVFEIEFSDGTQQMLHLYTRFPITQHGDVLIYFFQLEGARDILYQCTRMQRQFGRQTVYLKHHLLPFPITLTPEMGDVQFCNYLVDQLDHHTYN